MPKYISLLRGINVSGKNKIKMAELKNLYESMGFSDVTTYIQSGNVTFKSTMKNQANLANMIEREVYRSFGIKSVIFIKNNKEWQHVVDNNPFAHDSTIAPNKLYITFLKEKASQQSIKSLETLQSKKDEWQISNDVVYIFCANGYGRTKLTNNVLEKILNIPATTRNINTVCALLSQIG